MIFFFNKTGKKSSNQLELFIHADIRHRNDNQSIRQRLIHRRACLLKKRLERHGRLSCHHILNRRHSHHNSQKQPENIRHTQSIPTLAHTPTASSD